MAWYALMSGDPTVQGNYRLLPNYTQENPPPCGAGCIICAVFVDGTTVPPNLAGIQDQIANGLVTGVPQRLPGPPIPPRPYVVLLRC